MIASKAKARRGVRGVKDPWVEKWTGRLIRLVLTRVVLLRFRCKS